MANQSTSSGVRRKIAWAVLLLLGALAFTMVFIPALKIQPFKPQTPEVLALSYTLRSWAPVVTVLDLIAALLLAVFLWRGARGWWVRAFLVLLLAPPVAAAWFARQNHFEWAFAPLPNSSYAAVSEAGFVGNDEMVLAIEVNGDAVAYPIRQIAYHHVVEDTVGGVPVVTTY
jgi:hypothetical protein